MDDSGAKRGGSTGRRNCLIVAAIVGVAVAGGVIAFGGLVALYMYGADDQVVTAADREVVLTMAEVAAFVSDFEPQPAFESIEKVRFFDGSFEIDYTYEDPQEVEPYLNSAATVERSSSDAALSYSGIKSGYRIGLSAAGSDLVPRDDLFGWGDKSELWIIENEGAPVGNIFIGRKGGLVFNVMLSGVYFDDEAIAELLAPVLDRLEAYEIP